MSGTKGASRLPPPPPQKYCKTDKTDNVGTPSQGPVAEVSHASDLQERVRLRLMQSIAQDSTLRHLTTRADARLWHPFLPGIECHVLFEAAGTMSYLLRFAPGAVLPAHHHPVDEECLVLAGVLAIGTELELHEGDFHLAYANLPHAAIHSSTGAVIYLRGATPDKAMIL